MLAESEMESTLSTPGPSKSQVSMFVRTLAIAGRSLLGRPSLTLVAALTLALGIGANTAIFTVVNAVLLRPLAYPDSARLVKVAGTLSREERVGANLSPPDFQDFERDNTVFDRMSAIGTVGFVTLTGGGDAERLNATRVSAGFFETLRVEPALGRGFRPDEDIPNGPRITVIADGIWRRRFGADARILGRTVLLDAVPHTVIGILPPSFRHPEPDLQREPDVYQLFQWEAGQVSRSGRYIRAIGRLREGRTLSEARAELRGLAAGLEQRYPETNIGRSVSVEWLQDDIVGDARRALLILLGAVGVVLVIACANVASLLLASGSGRQKELAIRAALGASRARIVRQLLTESLVLASMGGAAGFVLAIWATRALTAMSAGILPRADAIAVDTTVLLFTAMASLATGVIFGIAPALNVSRLDLERTLRQGGRSSQSQAGRRTREALVAGEVALALVLLMASGLLIRSFWNLRAVDPGFDPERVLTLQISLPLARYPEGDQIPFYQRLYERLGALPGVDAVGAVNILPLTGNYSCDGFQIDERPVAKGRTSCAEARSVSQGYFRAMGLALSSGRLFTAGDTSASPPVVIINEALARRFWPGESPLGRRITYNRGLPPSDELTGGPGSREIVGVVGNVTHLSLDEALVPMFYTPQAQPPSFHTMILVLRAAGEEATLARAVSAEVRGLDPEVPTYQVRALQDLLDRSVSAPRLRTLLLGIFAALAAGLALVGVSALAAFAVGQRTAEIGVRIALGARPGDVIGLIVGQGLRPVALGLAIGVAGAWASGRLLSGLLFGVPPADPWTLGAVTVGLLAAALVASSVPALRASRIDPVRALRGE
jgi:putative ABC transport system permease protein